MELSISIWSKIWGNVISSERVIYLKLNIDCFTHCFQTNLCSSCRFCKKKHNLTKLNSEKILDWISICIVKILKTALFRDLWLWKSQKLQNLSSKKYTKFNNFCNLKYLKFLGSWKQNLWIKHKISGFLYGTMQVPLFYVRRAA